MFLKLSTRILIFSLFLSVPYAQALDAPLSTEFPAPSRVYLDPDRNVLMLEKPQENPKPFFIKGVNWSPATYASSFFLDDENGFNEFLRTSFTNHYQIDIPLLKQMSINTVRVFGDFGLDPAVYNPILDELYRNDIMVIMTPASSRDDMDRDQYDIYTNYQAGGNRFIPSGYFAGGGGSVTQIENETSACSSGTCVRMTFTGNGSGSYGGVCWQNTANNWGDFPGEDLTGFNKLVFRARSAAVSQRVNNFEVGYNVDSTHATLPNQTLSSTWKEYSINLSGRDMSNIRGGFCVGMSGGYGAQTIYLDDIRFIYDPVIGGPRRVPRVEQVIQAYKDHPAVLMWMLGNEWNLWNLYFGYSSITDAAEATNKTAQRIKELDPNHPVSSCLGDRFDDPNPDNTIASILQLTPDVDLWGLNIYRGPSFFGLFDQWQQLTNKPFFFSEFGIDSFNTDYYQINAANQAFNCTGSEDQTTQSNYLRSLWEEIYPQLSLVDPSAQCLGGSVFSFNDQLWKVGNYHVGLGGLVNYPTDHSYSTYNREGFYLPGASPDDVNNEEYFGLVSANRVPKQAYYEIQNIYNDLDSSVDTEPPIRSGWEAYNLGLHLPHPTPDSVVPYGTTSVTLSLYTDEPAACKVSTFSNPSYQGTQPYDPANPGVAVPYKDKAMMEETGGTYHATIMTGLTNGTIYTNFIQCRDAVGNTNLLDDYKKIFIVAPYPKPVVPQGPSNVQAPVIALSGVQLTWDPSPDTIRFYRILRAECGPNIGPKGGCGYFFVLDNSYTTSYTDTYALQPGRTYAYIVKAAGQGGGLSYCSKRDTCSLEITLPEQIPELAPIPPPTPIPLPTPTPGPSPVPSPSESPAPAPTASPSAVPSPTPNSSPAPSPSPS